MHTADKASKMTNSTEILVKYYDGLTNGDLQSVSECFDVPSKLISLYGVVDISSREEILKTYTDMIETWKKQGISNKIGYDKNEFDVSHIQKNIDLVKTELTNFDLEGNFIQKWDCTYIVRNDNARWLISLATSNNKTSKSIK